MNLTGVLKASLEDAGAIEEQVPVAGVSLTPEEELLVAEQDLIISAALISEGQEEDDTVETSANVDYALQQIEDAATDSLDGGKYSPESVMLAMSVMMARQGIEFDRPSFESIDPTAAVSEIKRRVSEMRSSVLQYSTESVSHKIESDVKSITTQVNRSKNSYKTVLLENLKEVVSGEDAITVRPDGGIAYDFIHVSNRIVPNLTQAISTDGVTIMNMLKVASYFEDFYRDVSKFAKKVYGSNEQDVTRLLDTIRRFSVARELDRLDGTPTMKNGEVTTTQTKFSGNDWNMFDKISITYRDTPHDGSSGSQSSLDEAIAAQAKRNYDDARNKKIGHYALGGLVGGGLLGAAARAALGRGMFPILLGAVGGAVGGNILGRSAEVNPDPVDEAKLGRRINYAQRGKNTQVKMSRKDIKSAVGRVVDICNNLDSITSSMLMTVRNHEETKRVIMERLTTREDIHTYVDLALTIGQMFTGTDLSAINKDNSKEAIEERNKAIMGQVSDYMDSIYMTYISIISTAIDHLTILMAGMVSVCRCIQIQENHVSNSVG